MSEFNATKFPFLLGVKLGEFGSSPLMDNSLYRQLVGILLYLTHSRPDLDNVVCDVVIYMQETHDIHWKDAKIILHYVQGTKHFGIHYVASSPVEQVGFIDSDWDVDSTDTKFTSDYVFIISYCTI